MNDIDELPVETKKDKGFTLIELLIVIVILGVLATVTVFAVRGITDKGEESACSADKNTLETATEAYFAQKQVSTIPTFDDPVTTAVDPSAEAELVHAGIIRAMSTKFDVSAAGDVTATSGGDCA